MTTEADRLKILLDLTRSMMASRDFYELFALIVRESTRLLGADRGTLYIVDRDTNQLWSLVAQQLETQEIRISIDENSIAGYAALYRTLINIEDAYRDPRFNQSFDQKTGYRTQTILAAPMIDHRGELIGVLQVLNKKNGLFGPEDEEMLQALASQAAIALENASLIEENEKQFSSFIEALADLIDGRSPFTAGHSERVTQYALNIGRAIGFSPEDMKKLEIAGLLHDLGKIAVPDQILNKPGKLTEDEYEKIREHAAYTRRYLNKIYFSRELKDVPLIAASHHERLDGEGYPLKLSGDGIPLMSQILAVVDIFDSLTAHDRPYRKALPIEEVLAILTKGKGTAFSSTIVDLFVERRLYEIERRESIRYDVNLRVHVASLKDTDDKRRGDTVCNLSSGGLCYTTSREWQVGDRVDVTIHLERRILRAVGQIIWCDGKPESDRYRVGLAFAELSNDVRRALGRYLIDLARARIASDSLLPSA